MNKIAEFIGKHMLTSAKDGVNYCRCCGGSVKCVGPLNNKGVCGDCAAEYSKPEYHKNGDEQEQENDNEGV